MEKYKQLRKERFEGLVFSSPGPRDVGEKQANVGRAGLYRAPAGGLAVEVRDEAARCASPWMAAAGLRAQPLGAFIDGN